MVGVVPNRQHCLDGNLPCSTIFSWTAMQVTYTDLMYEAESQGLAPEDIAGDYHEVFAAWAGFKSVNDMMRWRLDVVDAYGMGDVDQYPYQPDMVPGFNWEPLYQRAMEQDFNYLHF
jgi:hypothetical protein